jgi:hypothetical protein
VRALLSANVPLSLDVVRARATLRLDFHWRQWCRVHRRRVSSCAGELEASTIQPGPPCCTNIGVPTEAGDPVALPSVVVVPIEVFWCGRAGRHRQHLHSQS